MNEVRQTQHLLSEIIDFVKMTPWRAEYQNRFERFYDSAEKPCVLAIAGQVKAGKSSFLNALLGLDLAAVGTTETTATINVFKYGRVKDPNRPVMVYWNDGRNPESQTKAFIDSLQGFTESVLEKAENIDHLEYIIEDDKLEEITLVDTPGFASVVDKHEERMADYFSERREKLRNKQIEKSGNLTEKADAVIFLSGPVAKANAQRFFSERIPHISPFNAVGVMAKIDMINPPIGMNTDKLEEINTVKKEAVELADFLAETFEHDLHSVLPVSASLYHCVNKLWQTDRVSELQRLIREIPSDKFDKRFDKNSEHWFAQEGPYNSFFEKCGLAFSVRQSMVGDMPWMFFCIIAVALYYKTLDEAKVFLLDFSGMEKVKSVLNDHFFKRSRSIRCCRVLRDAQQQLVYIKNIELPRKLTEVQSRKSFLKIIDDNTGRYDSHLLEAFSAFVKRNLSDASDLNMFQNSIDALLAKIEGLLKSMDDVEKNNDGLLLLNRVKNLLHGEKEYYELKMLLDQDHEKLQALPIDYCNKRQRIWNARKQQTNNAEMKKILSIVCDCYGKLLKNN